MRAPIKRVSILISLIVIALMSLLIEVATPSSSAVPHSQPSCAPPPSGMVSWWQGEGNANDIQDGNDGIFNGTPAYGSGEVGQAFSFNGDTANYVFVPHNTNLDLTQFTVDAWVYPTFASGIGTVIGTVIDKEGGNGINYALFVDDRGLVEIDYNPGAHQFVDSPAGSAPPNTWTHITGTYDGPSGSKTLKLYINGVLVGTHTAEPGMETPPTGQDLYIGVRNGGGVTLHSPFQGLIDEVEVFDHALTQTEIKAIFNAGSAGKCRTCTPPPSSMLNWWPGDGNADDIQGNNNGTFIGETSPGSYAPGKVGQAFSFDGVDDYVSVPSNAAWNFGTGDFAVDFWARSSSNSRMHALSFGETLSSNNLDFDFNDSFGLWVYWNSGGSSNIQVGSPGDYTDGQWRHFTLTRSGDTLTLYIDGVAVGSTTYTGVVDLSNSTNNSIGARTSNVTPDVLWQGEVDEVEIFNRALSQTEIKAIVNAGNIGKCKPAPSSADLDIHKSSSSDAVLLGQNVSYKIEVENEGPSTATNVTITDTLPSSLTNISAPGCSISGRTVTCIIASLANGQEVRRSITAKTTATGKITNTTSVTANEPDPDLSNNTDKESTKVVVGVKSVSLDPSTVKRGKDVTGTVKLSGSASSNTVVTLSSSNTSVAKPSVSSITISAGNTSKNFTVKTFAVSSTKTVKIKASANGTSKEATLTVTR